MAARTNSRPFGDLSTEAPHLAALIEHIGEFPPSSRSSVSHHPLTYLTRGNISWRRETLRVLDRVVELVQPILARTGREHRYSTRLRDGPQFTPAVAELVAGARLAAIATTTDTIDIDPPDGLPDVAFDLGGRRVHAEVYAPRSWRQLDIVDELRDRMKSHGSSCRFHLAFPRPVARRSDWTKAAVNTLRRIANDVEAANAQGATFFAKSLADPWTVRIGSIDPVTEDHALIGWAHRDDHGPPTSILGSIDAKYVSADEDARNAVSDLHQLVEGFPNLLIIDLSGRPMDPFTLSAYERAATATGQRHPLLSAVLLTGRSCRLRPSPHTDFEACSWYRVVPNPRCASPLAPAELDLLEKPGLILPGVG
jgi:hypothetical protein